MASFLEPENCADTVVAAVVVAGAYAKVLGDTSIQLVDCEYSHSRATNGLIEQD